MRAVVIEDSRLARQGLIRMLSQFKSVSVVGDAEHPEQARELIAAEEPDLLFLDIHMPGETGFELLASLSYTPKVIFTTAYADYAVESFEYNTVDYLLKPISEERLAAAIAKLEKTVTQPTPAQSTTSDEKSSDEEAADDASAPPLKSDSQIFVKDGDHCHLIKLTDIQYIESCKNYVQLFFNGKKAFIKKSLNSVEERLPNQVFFRASRQFIVNLQSIQRIDESISDGYTLTMQDGTQIEVSRRNSVVLKDILSL